MPRYIFRVPIDGILEIHADGESLDDAVENYMNGEGNAEEFPDYTMDNNDVVGIDCIDS